MTARAPSTGEVAVVLLSGGLDSTTVLALAAEGGREVHALSFRYGQRHAVELACAARQASRFGARQHVVVDLSHVGELVAPATALVDGGAHDVPKDEDPAASSIPVTYVPARNTLFLSYALAWAEALSEGEDGRPRDIGLWIGVNAIDYSGYPDCRPEFIAAFERAATLGTRAGAEGRCVQIHAPLIAMTKAEIVRAGLARDVDYGDTVSCYDPRTRSDGAPLACGRCDSCQLRRQGFVDAGVSDPTRYAPN